MKRNVKITNASLENRERALIGMLCSDNPSVEEVRWYEKQMKLFESANADEASLAMDNMIIGYQESVVKKSVS